MDAMPPQGLSKPPSIWENRKFQIVYSILFVAVVVLASVSIYYDFLPRPNEGTPGPTFTIDNVTLSFGGPSPSNLTPATSWCPSCLFGTYEVATPLQIDVGVALVTAAASCSHLNQTLVYEVVTPSTGKFQIENVKWNGSSPTGSGSLPVHLPYGNSTVCESTIDLLVTVGYIPPGPSNDTLSLTVLWDYATVIVP